MQGLAWGVKKGTCSSNSARRVLLLHRIRRAAPITRCRPVLAVEQAVYVTARNVRGLQSQQGVHFVPVHRARRRLGRALLLEACDLRVKQLLKLLAFEVAFGRARVGVRVRVRGCVCTQQGRRSADDCATCFLNQWPVPQRETQYYPSRHSHRARHVCRGATGGAATACCLHSVGNRP